MREFVPDDVRHIVAALEEDRCEGCARGHQSEEDTRTRQIRISALREEREADLKAACGIIDGWLGRFEQTIGPALWRLAAEGIVLYTAPFWNGEPVSPSEAGHSAQLRFEPPGQTKGRLVYEELEDGRISARYWRGGALHLWRSLHPDFVLRCAAHIESGRVWDTIRGTLEHLKRS